MSPTLPPLPSRRVRRLHVRAAVEDDARHAATLLGDALRTASLRVADEARLVVIRRLPLGRISARISAASLALHVERVAAGVIADAVAYNLAGAGTANAVVFASRAEAVVALAHLHASGSSTLEWFWPEVVRGWRADAARSVRWTFLMEAAHASPAAAVVAAAVVDRAIGAGVEDELLSDVSPRRAIDWLRLEGWTDLDLAPATTAPAWQWPDGRRGQALRRWFTAWDVGDARLVWLATLMSVSEQPARAADPRLPGRIAAVFESLGAARGATLHDRPRAIDDEIVGAADETGRGQQTRSTSAAADTQVFDRLDAATESEGGQAASADRRQCIRTPEQVAELSAGTAQNPQAGALVVARCARDRPLSSVPLPEWTAFGGLLFLIPVLERLEFLAFLTQHPGLLESAFPSRLLYAIGRRAGMPESDPLALACRARAGGDADAAGGLALDAVRFELPAAVRAILSSPAPRASIATPTEAWLTAVRRWCRRYPRIGVRTLIGRRATVHMSRTHIDANFALSDLDVRVRRWALDVDPGWVPWFGRVVTFTYGNSAR